MPLGRPRITHREPYDGQPVVGCRVSLDLLAALDLARGSSPRSEFLRHAIRQATKADAEHSAFRHITEFGAALPSLDAAYMRVYSRRELMEGKHLESDVRLPPRPRAWDKALKRKANDAVVQSEATFTDEF